MLLRERTDVADFESSHFTTQLIERAVSPAAEPADTSR